MLSLREQLKNGLMSTQSSSVKIPKKSEFKGTITPEGYCDYEVEEGEWYLEKNNSKRIRMNLSNKARNHRKELRSLKSRG